MANLASGALHDTIAAAHARLLADRSLQFGFASEPDRRPPRWLLAMLRWLAAHAGGAAPRHVAPWAAYAPWAVLAVVVVGGLVLLLRGFAPARRGRAPGRAPLDLRARESWRPEASQARALLADADRLAGEGRYAEAAHVLLLRSIADLETRVSKGIAASLTSRDIAALPDLPSAAREAFASLAVRVERTIFGGAALGAADWTACREAYTRFAFQGAWSPT